MGAIAGQIDFERPVDEQVVARMCRVMEHRGPDASGLHVDDGVAIGAEHLEIVDPGGPAQPCHNEDASVVAVMNGEIYNHDELRQRLERSGHRFRSNSDTEVLAHLYEQYGDRL